MGSFGGGALLKVALYQTGRKLHKPILVKDISGSLHSCIRVNLLSTHPPLDEKVLRGLVDDNSDSGSRIPRLDKESARRLAKNFTSDDRQLLLKEIQQIKGDEDIRTFSGSLASLRWRSRFGRPASVGEADPTGRFCLISTNWLKQRLMTSIPKPTPGQLIHTALFNSIPFIGFGFLDNVIMITAGDYIEASVGVAFSISTMAAAALGNAVSDVAGIGSAFYVEMWAMRIGIPAPNMTPEQHDLKIALWFSNIGRAFGVAFGCLLGMFPLFFLPGHNKQDEPAGAAGTVVPVVNAEDAPVVTSQDASVVTSSGAPAGQSKAKTPDAPVGQSKAKFSEVSVTMRLPPPIPVSTAASSTVAVPTNPAVVSSSSPACASATPPSSPDHTNTTPAPSAAAAAATAAATATAANNLASSAGQRPATAEASMVGDSSAKCVQSQ